MIHCKLDESISDYYIFLDKNKNLDMQLKAQKELQSLEKVKEYLEKQKN